MFEIVTSLKNSVDGALAEYPPWQVVALTLASVAALVMVQAVVRALRKYGLVGAITMLFLSVAKSVPMGASAVANEQRKMIKSLEKSMLGKYQAGKKRFKLPKKGLDEQELFDQMDMWKEAEEAIWKPGKVSGAVYHGGAELKEIINRAYQMFSFANPLHPDVFPYVRRMEAEVVRMSVDMFHGDEECCGSMTSGGTESILLAMKVYRDEAHSRGIMYPEVVAPETAHAAFDKAAHYFGIKLVSIRVNQETFEADVAAMEKAITKNTVALVGSAPSFPQGVLDPITELGALARKYRLHLHVDACLGGFLLPHVVDLGYEVDKFDFLVPEVTSISADPHKFGFAPKGCSLVLYRSANLRKFQYFVQPNWPGGIYASPTIAGSRPGGLIAGCWAAMMVLGKAGYMEHARKIMKSAKAIEAGISNIPGLRVMGTPVISVVAFDTVDGTDIFMIADALTERGWNLNSLQFPRSIHICVTNMQANMHKTFLKELKEAVEEVRSSPGKFKEGSAAMYGMAATIPDRSIVQDLTTSFLDVLYKV